MKHHEIFYESRGALKLDKLVKFIFGYIPKA